MNWDTNLRLWHTSASRPQVVPKLPDCKTLPSFGYPTGGQNQAQRAIQLKTTTAAIVVRSATA